MFELGVTWRLLLRFVMVEVDRLSFGIETADFKEEAR